jgi:hypothetical protein
MRRTAAGDSSMSKQKRGKNWLKKWQWRNSHGNP